ncbi:E3 ubiquitin-protein ligase RNF186 [Lithobates pipiens]
MGEEMSPPEATKEILGCGHLMEINLEAGETTEEPQEVPPSTQASSPPESSEVQQMVNQGSDDSTPSSSKVEITNSSCLTDMDCPVCFSRYDIHRLPKELSCKHSFCAICLKLLVCNEAGTWMIACPICRATTTVFGGLICTLKNQELLMSRLPTPEEKLIASEASIRLDRIGMTWISDEERTRRQWTAAKRLVVLLLMLLIILIIILQFIYTGIMKWMLGFALGVVVIITVLLSFNPYWKLRLPGATSQPKDDTAAAKV